MHLNAQAKLDTIGIIRDGASQVHALMAGLKSDQIRSMAAIVVNDDTCNTDLQAATIKLQNLWNVLKPSQSLFNQQRGCGRQADRYTGSTVRSGCGNTYGQVPGRSSGRGHGGRGNQRGITPLIDLTRTMMAYMLPLIFGVN